MNRAALFPVLAAVSAAAFAQAPVPLTPEQQAAKDRATYIRANYTKHEYLLPMRDGVRLFTQVYAPKDTSQPYPILLNRTPYRVRPYGVDNYRGALASTAKFEKEGFLFVFQDVRGKGKSEGTYSNVRPHNPRKQGPKEIDEASDTFDTIDWLVKNVANNNGKVGMLGISYPGFYALVGAVDAHPALKATSPQAPVTDWFIGDDFRHNGVLFLSHAYRFFNNFGRTWPGDREEPPQGYDMQTPDGYEFHLRTGALANYNERYFQGNVEFWKELIENDTYNEFWRSRNIRQYLKKVTPAVMAVGGWFDAEDLFGPLRVFDAIEAQSGGTKNHLVMGPWIHGGWSRNAGDKLGPVPFQSSTSEYYRDEIEFPFFLFHLKGKGDGKFPKAHMFETGRNEWHKHDSWPPKEAKPRTYYFQASGKLSLQAPEGRGEAFDEYVSDPNKPVPFTSDIVRGMSVTYMVDDQRFATSRTDVLSYQTEPLEGDVRVAGPLTAALHVSTTGTDSDWVVKLIDVYPADFPDPDPNPGEVRMGGYQQLVRGEPFRGKFRKSFEKPEPFTPGKMDKVEFELPDVYHTFRRGHRIMVHVQSSWFPLGDRNPQKFLKIHEAKAEDFQKATQRVFRMSGAASGLKVRVLE